MTTVEDIKELLFKNKKRFAKELLESKEVMHLIKKSMTENLTVDEKEKIKGECNLNSV